MEITTNKGIVFFIDKQDEKRVRKLNWYLDHGYIRNSKNKHVYLHRFILDFPKGFIDHIDGNPLNNCRKNLRICTQQQNIMNKTKTKNSTSKYKGVSWNKKEKIWYSYINKDYKTYYIGRFRDEIEAAISYDKKAKEMFGEFAKINTYATL